MVHAFNPMWKAEAGISLRSRPAWSTESSRTARTTQRNPVFKTTTTKKKLFFLMNIGVFVSMYVCVPWAYLVPKEARRACEIPGDWSYRCL